MSAEFFHNRRHYKPDTVAARLHVHRATVYRWISRDGLRAIDQRHPGSARSRLLIYGRHLNSFLARHYARRH